MKELKYDLPEKYVEESRKLLEERIRKTSEISDKIRKEPHLRHDQFAREEKAILDEFNKALEALKVKYHVFGY